MNQRKQAAFTIIELLIVIVVIAILAAITIVAYNGITQKARVATLQSDLTNGYTTLGTYNATNGNYPGYQSAAGLKATAGDTLAYTVTSDQSAYCLEATGWGVSYTVTNNNNVPAVGYCAGATSATGSQPAVSTYAGNGTMGYVDGPGTSAEFEPIEGVAFDSAGNLYVADNFNNCIRKVTSAQIVSTFAGTCGEGSTYRGYADGAGSSAKFDFPISILADSSGNIYVADDANNCIRKITPSQVVSTYAGICNTSGSTWGYVDGSGSSAEFAGPEGLALDSSGNLYVADGGNSCIRKITTAQVVSTFAGTCSPSGSTRGQANGTGAAAQFNWPDGLAFDSSGSLYVADTSNSCIRKITSSQVVSTFAGTCGTQGYVDGVGTAARFNDVWGIAVSSSGNIYATDQNNNCIRKITSGGVVSTYAGICDATGNSWGYVDGPGSMAKFNGPNGIAIDSSGNLYIADYSNSVIRKITP